MATGELGAPASRKASAHLQASSVWARIQAGTATKPHPLPKAPPLGLTSNQVQASRLEPAQVHASLSLADQSWGSPSRIQDGLGPADPEQGV